MNRKSKTAQRSVGESADQDVDNVFGQYVLGDFRPSDLLDTAGALAQRAALQPGAVARAAFDFVAEARRIAAGQSELVPEPGDRRFADAAWQENPRFRGLLKGYLALCRSLQSYAQSSGLDPKQAERAQFLMTQIGDALAPTNFLPGNPAALRRARETRGASLWRGVKNFAKDVAARRPIPAQVDERAFKVGGNLAVTPGAVVLRHDMFELLQYAPQTAQVRQRPIFVVPSIVNKYYAFDIAPGRSVFEHFIKQGFTVFVMVWRNPKPEHDHWGIPAYQEAIDAGVSAARDIAQIDSVNMWAVCGAGPVAVSLVGYYAAAGERKVNSLMLFVSPLDMQAMADAPTIGAFVDKQSMPHLKQQIRKRRMSAKQFTLLFAMLRANDLIWNYWVNNYLMGNTPSAFDILYWNGDGTGMTAQFNHDFSLFVEQNPLLTPGAMTVRGTPIPDLATLDIDSYVLGAATDHLCAWTGVYRSARLLGPRSQFVLGNSGHIQTIVCPPGNPKASFFTNPALPATPEAWMKGATKNQGSWWDHCVAWTAERAGPLIDAPAKAGNARYPVIGKAPGTYVHERA
ncbi:MAG: alpha/beta fold hydrolase [Panacagrimonas sp.]